MIINPPTNDDLERGESQSEVHIKYDKERQGYITRSDQKGLLSKLAPAYSLPLSLRFDIATVSNIAIYYEVTLD
jgi:hypothetical protein